MGILAKSINAKAIDKALTSLPTTLYETYDRILATVDAEHREMARNILTWLAYSERTLTIPELLDAIAIKEDHTSREDLDEEILYDPDDIFHICSSLVAVSIAKVSGRSFKGVALAHFTVKEYLQTEHTMTHCSFRFPSFVDAHDQIASGCLTYLALQVREYDMKDGERDCYKEYPLLIYAEQFWGHHYRNGYRSVKGPWYDKLFSVEDDYSTRGSTLITLGIFTSSLSIYQVSWQLQVRVLWKLFDTWWRVVQISIVSTRITAMQ
jgi:hypothetical protein